MTWCITILNTIATSNEGQCRGRGSRFEMGRTWPYGLSEVSWAPNGSGGPPAGKLKIKTEMLISGHFSGYSELQCSCITTLYTHIIYAHAMYMIALQLVTSNPDTHARSTCMLLCLHCHTRTHTHSLCLRTCQKQVHVHDCTWLYMIVHDCTAL